MNKQIQDMTIVELKALVYDHMIVIENSQKAIQIINQEIARKQQPQQSQLNGTPNSEPVTTN